MAAKTAGIDTKQNQVIVRLCIACARVRSGLRTYVVDVTEACVSLRNAAVLPVVLTAAHAVRHDGNVDRRLVDWVSARLQ